MCTVSWLRRADEYDLFCNRDELYTRQPALPPRGLERRGVKILAPVDGDFGGSWIGVNEFGLTLCLVNRYDPVERTDGFISRGVLLLELLDSGNVAELSARIAAQRMTEYRPFTMLALHPDTPARLIHWNGQEKLLADAADSGLLISSSFDSAGVTTARRQLFAQMKSEADGVSADLLWRFHGSHAPERGPYSPCMHRADAQTVSFSRVQMRRAALEFSYFPAAPCTLTEKADQYLNLSLSRRDR